MVKKYTAEEKLKNILEFEKTDISLEKFSKSKEIHPTTFRGWLRSYENFGKDGLTRRPSQKYSYETKLEAVKAYLDHEGTQNEIVVRFGLRSAKTLRNWLVQYNNDKNLRATPIRRKVVTMSKKTTLEERIQVVEYVTLHNHSYSEASEHFGVSYQQTRLWVMKVKSNGYSSLADNRGHRGYKEKDNLTEVDKLNLKIRELEAEIQKHEAIEAFEKKFNEIQHGE